MAEPGRCRATTTVAPPGSIAGVADATRLPYYDPFMGCGSEDDQHPPPGWKMAGFGSKEEAEAYKARARAQYGRSVSFPWDGYSG